MRKISLTHENKTRKTSRFCQVETFVRFLWRIIKPVKPKPYTFFPQLRVDGVDEKSWNDYTKQNKSKKQLEFLLTICPKERIGYCSRSGYYIRKHFEELLNPGGVLPESNNKIAHQHFHSVDTDKLLRLSYKSCVGGGCNCNYYYQEDC